MTEQILAIAVPPQHPVVSLPPFTLSKVTAAVESWAEAFARSTSALPVDFNELEVSCLMAVHDSCLSAAAANAVQVDPEQIVEITDAFLTEFVAVRRRERGRRQ